MEQQRFVTDDGRDRVRLLEVIGAPEIDLDSLQTRGNDSDR